jgi:hypothetical protein
MSQPMGNAGNNTNLPTSSNWGIPSSWDFSKQGMPMGLLGIMVAIVLVLVAMYLLKGGRRRR